MAKNGNGNGSKSKRSSGGNASKNTGKARGRSSSVRGRSSSDSGANATRQSASGSRGGRAGGMGGRSAAKASGQSSSSRAAGATASPGRSTAGGAVDALDLLKAQHREVEGLFKQFERAENDNECFEVAQVICQKLTVHATIEEEIFYPMARAQGEQSDEEELKDKVLEALEEHLSAKRLIADIQGLDAGDERLEAKISVLKEQVSHHVDEEEDEMFPQIKKQLSKDERRTLGQQLQQRTGELEMDAEGEGGAGQQADELDQEEGVHGQSNGAAMDAGAQRSSSAGGRQSSRSGVTHHSHH